MPWQGDGSFQRDDGTRRGVNVWEQAREANVNVNSRDHDHHDEDLAKGIALCVSREGRNSPTADLPMGGHKHTGAGDATQASHYATFGQLLSHAVPFVPAPQVSQSQEAPDVITLSPQPEAAGYEVGRGYRFIVKEQNTGAVSVVVNSLAQQALKKQDGSDFKPAELKEDEHLVIVYNGSEFRADAGGTGGVDEDVVNRLIAAADLDAGKLASGTVAAARLAANPSRRKVLTIDASGVAVWQDPFTVSSGRIWAEPADGAVIIRYAQPASEEPVTRRTVQVRRQGTRNWTAMAAQDALSSPHRFGGLANGTAYDFRIIFRTASMRSANSNVASATPAPAFHRASAVGDTTFTWPWQETSALVVVQGGQGGGSGQNANRSPGFAGASGSATTVEIEGRTITGSGGIGGARSSIGSSPGNRNAPAVESVSGLSIGDSIKISVGAGGRGGGPGASGLSRGHDGTSGFAVIAPV